jgi:activator of HSP90 ATPase
MVSTTNPSVHVVLQRYRSCKILINEDVWVTQGVEHEDTEVNNDSTIATYDSQQQHCGLLIYVSFASNTDGTSCLNAAETCLNMPILTTGLWGDNTSQLYSIQQHITNTNTNNQSREHNPTTTTSITIVPQANLICKVKSHGTSIQYHNQIDKDQGQEYYNLFVDYIRVKVFEWYYIATQQQDKLPESFIQWKMQRFHVDISTKNDVDTSSSSIDTFKFDPSILPIDIFRSMKNHSNLYTSFDDDTGLPITDHMGIPITKSAIKKLRKIQDLHRQRHEKWCQQQQQQQATLSELPIVVDKMVKNEIETSIQNNNGSSSRLKSIRSLTNDVSQCNVTEIGPETTVEEGWSTVHTKSNNNDNDYTNKLNTISTTTNESYNWEALELQPFIKSHINIVAGTFGKRQGIFIQSDMGPFCHVVQI